MRKLFFPWRWIGLALLAILLLPTVGAGAVLKQVAQVPGGIPVGAAIDTSRNLLISGFYDGFYVTDIQDPNNPQIISLFSYPSFARAFCYSENRVYVAGVGFLGIIDLGDPHNPVLIASHDIGNWRASSISVSNNVVYIGQHIFETGVSRLALYDISSLDNIYPLNTMDFSSEWIVHIQVGGNHAYFLKSSYDGSPGDFTALDVSDPLDLRVLDSYTISVNISGDGFELVGGKAYILDTDSNKFHILDITNPANIQFISNFSENVWVGGIAVSGDVAAVLKSYYGGTNNDELKLFDVSDSQSPVEIGSLNFNCDATIISMEGNHVYLFDQVEGLKIVNIANPAALQVVSLIDLPTSGPRYIKDNIMFTVSSGLSAIDISDPNSPVFLDYLRSPYENCYNSKLVANTIFVSCPDRLLRYDITNPSDLQVTGERGFTDTLNNPLEQIVAFDINGNLGVVHAIKIDGSVSRMFFIDPTDPGLADVAAPRDVSAWNLSHVYIENDLLYVLTKEDDTGTQSHLRIVDVAGGGFTEIGYCLLSGMPYKMAIQNGFSYVVTYNDEVGASYLYIIDIMDPFNPRLLNSVPYDGYFDVLEVDGNVIYASYVNSDNTAMGQTDFQFIDVINPMNIQVIGALTYPWLVMGDYVTVADGKIYVHIHGVSVHILSETLLRGTEIRQADLKHAGRYKLGLAGKYSSYSWPLKATWSSLNPVVADMEGDILTANQTGWVGVQAGYDGGTYTAMLPVYKDMDLMEIESNNSMVTANAIQENRFYNGYIYAGDSDFHRLDLPSDSIVSFGYLSRSLTADMKVDVLDNEGQLLGTIRSIDGRLAMLRLGLVSGTYYLRVEPDGDVDQDNSYTVGYRVLGALLPVEPLSLTVGESLNGAINTLQDVVSIDVAVAENDGLNFVFSPGGSQGEYRLLLKNAMGEEIDSIDCVDSVTVVMAAAYAPGSYTLDVIPLEGIDATASFNISLETVSGQVENEPAESYRDATEFDITTPASGRLSSDTDVDYFSFELTDPRYLEMTVDCLQSGNDLLVNIYKDSDQNLIDGIIAQKGELTSFHFGLGIGRYYLKVTGIGGEIDTVHPYTIGIQDSSQTNLEIESNNTVKFANAIEKASARNGRIFSAGDTDYYGFHLSEAGLFNVSFSSISSTGDYTVSLVNENDQIVDLRESVNGAPCSMAVYQLPGNFYIKIESNGDIDQYNQYELQLTSDAVIEGIKKIVSVTLTGPQDEMTISDTQNLSAMASYSDATAEPIASPIWSSLNPSVATVDSSGLVTAVAEGTTTIVATHGGLTGSFDITVGAPAQVVAQHYGSLVIVAGSGTGPEDPLNESAQYLANLVYKRFQTRLFKDEDIYYLNPVAEHDLDGDGYNDNIVDDATPTITEFGQAITNWAASQDTDGPLFIYMVGHGLIDTFSFPSETLTAASLNGFIDTFQAATGRRVVIIIEACKSGSFVDDLVHPGKNRIVITSTDEQDAYMQWEGRISFTQFFINKLLGGGSLHAGWVKGKDKLGELDLPFSLMNPQLADGIASISEYTWLGGEFVIADPFPGMLLGQVMDISTGVSIQGANINLGGDFNLTTLDNGAYITTLPTGTYTVTVTADGYSPSILTNLLVGIGDSLVRNFSLSSLASIAKGDLDALNGIDLADAVIALKALVGIDISSHLRADYVSSGIDVNGDDNVGLDELIYILQGVSGSRQ